MTDSIAFRGRRHKSTAGTRTQFAQPFLVTPTVEDITPFTDTTIGGRTVTVTGTNFIPGMAVTVGGIPATQVTYVSSTTLQVVIPPNYWTGIVEFVVRRPDNGVANPVPSPAFVYEDPEMINGLRLTLVTGTPVSTTNTTSSTIYLTPYLSGRIALHNGVYWQVVTTSEISIALSGLTSGKNYDVFAYWTGSAVALELSAAWTSDVARNNLLTRLDGVLVKSADNTRRYLGTFRAISATTTTDTLTQRFLWNFYNRVSYPLLVSDSTASWTQTTSTFRAANSTTTNHQFEVVCGDYTFADAYVSVMAGQTTNQAHVRVGVGIDSTTTDSANAGGFLMAVGTFAERNANWEGSLTAGYHFIVWLEQGENATTTWFGDGSATTRSARMRGSIMG